MKAVDLCSWILSTALVMNGIYGVAVLTGPTTTDVRMMTILEYNVHQVNFRTTSQTVQSQIL